MKRQIVLIVSLVAGLAAALLTRVYLSSKDAEYRREREKLAAKYGTMDVVVFKRDVTAGSTIMMEDIGKLRVPEMGMRGQAVPLESFRELIGRKTVLGHSNGDVVFWSDIEGGDQTLTGLSSDVHRLMRAVSINVNGASSVSGMVRPNDHVDVIGTFTFPGADGTIKKGDIVTSTILQNVLVLATGRETAKSLVAQDLGSLGGSNYATVTLEVTPREAEMLAFAEQMKGRLTLTLRNKNDTSFEKALPQVDYDKIRAEIEELNNKRQQKIQLGPASR